MSEKEIEDIQITIKIRRKLKEELEIIKKKNNLSSLSDTIKLLMTANYFLNFMQKNINEGTLEETIKEMSETEIGSEK